MSIEARAPIGKIIDLAELAGRRAGQNLIQLALRKSEQSGATIGSRCEYDNWVVAQEADRGMSKLPELRTRWRFLVLSRQNIHLAVVGPQDFRLTTGGEIADERG